MPPAVRGGSSAPGFPMQKRNRCFGRKAEARADLREFAPEPHDKLDLATTLEAARSSGIEGQAMKGMSSGGIVTKGRIMSRSSCSRM
jgi:hypothetical protein